MLKALSVVAGLVVSLTVAESASAQTCATWPYPLNDGSTAYGSQVMANFNCTARLNSPHFTGYVGIGNAAPQSPLSVTGQVVIGQPYRGDASLHITQSYGGYSRLTQMNVIGANAPALNLMASNDGNGNQNWWAWGVNNNKFTINSGTTFTGNFVIDGGGNVGIGTASPISPLDVVGGIRIENYGYLAFNDPASTAAFFQLQSVDGNFVFYNSNAVGTIYPSFYQFTKRDGAPFVFLSAVSMPSDERLKKNIQPVASGLSVIQKLRPVRYQWRAKGERSIGKNFSLDEQQGQIGFVAQELQQVVPEAVNAPINANDIYTMRQDVLIPLLVKAVQELQDEVDQLKKGK